MAKTSKPTEPREIRVRIIGQGQPHRDRGEKGVVTLWEEKFDGRRLYPIELDNGRTGWCFPREWIEIG